MRGQISGVPWSRACSLAVAAPLVLMSVGSASAQVGGREVPDILSLTLPQARAALDRAGYTEVVIREKTTQLCGPVVAGRIFETGQICQQDPKPGRRDFFKWINVTVQKEDPRHGNLGKPNEWHLMPDVTSKTPADAMVALREAGLTNDGSVQISHVTEPGCKPGLVCRTYPKPHERIGLNSGKVLYVGQ
jgi:beta-lactam-binding protein with PASTA domain